MKLTYNQFLVLTEIEKSNDKLSQRDISKLTKLSLGTINKIITEFLEHNLIDSNNLITEYGLKALEPYRVKRAIFLAAGFGSRLVPITLNTPKPLVLVNGKKIIETLLDACVKAQIEEIIIVTGYLNEQFEILTKKYPNIKLVYNGKYNEANNISSAYLIRDKFANSYVLESDLYLYNQDLIRKYEYHSNFLCKYVDVTDDWCFEVKDAISSRFHSFSWTGSGIPLYQSRIALCEDYAAKTTNEEARVWFLNDIKRWEQEIEKERLQNAHERALYD